ncbi:hypothetical protein EDB85DRAFT_990460 [Lactarius pseudohatsudake]|nr:hypothetical protein EDB85DRAFT_990460 [Lactarius pseudohatsudake]
MKYALNYPRSGQYIWHWSGSELKKGPGARLPDLKVSITPSILPANDLAVDPFCPVSSAASPASQRCNDSTLAQTRRSCSFHRHARRPIRCSQGRKDEGASVATLRPVSLPPYFSCSMRTTRLGTAANRSRRTCAGARRRASDPGFVLVLNKFAPPPPDPNVTLSIPGLAPAHGSPRLLHRRSPPPSQSVRAEWGAQTVALRL